MSLPLRIHEAAEADLAEAASFYDHENPGLGAVFIDEVSHAFDGIVQFPEASSIIAGRVRKKLLVKFPYSVMYSVLPGEIRVLAIAHQRRRPFYWRDRD